MHLAITHTTHYAYGGYASESQNELRLTPHSDASQCCHAFALTVAPSAPLSHDDLPWGRVHRFNLQEPHQTLTIRIDAVVETLLADPFVRMNLAVDDVAAYDAALRETYREWLTPTERVPHEAPELAPALDALAEQAAARADGPTAAHFLIALTGLIRDEFPYAPGATHVGTTLAELLTHHRRGVCQDHAHLMLAVCRRRGIPARYVSGYLYTGNGLQSGDVMHAWVECLLPDAFGTGSEGQWLWRGFDPANNVVVGKSYVKVFHGRDYVDAAPTRGVYTGPPTTQFTVTVHVSEVPAEGAAGQE